MGGSGSKSGTDVNRIIPETVAVAEARMGDATPCFLRRL